MFKLASFNDIKTVVFLDKKEISYCIQQLKDIYPNENTRNNQETSGVSSGAGFGADFAGLTSFALNSGIYHSFFFLSNTVIIFLKVLQLII